MWVCLPLDCSAESLYADVYSGCKASSSSNHPPREAQGIDTSRSFGTRHGDELAPSMSALCIDLSLYTHEYSGSTRIQAAPGSPGAINAAAINHAGHVESKRPLHRPDGRQLAKPAAPRKRRSAAGPSPGSALLSAGVCHAALADMSTFAALLWPFTRSWPSCLRLPRCPGRSRVLPIDG